MSNFAQPLGNVIKQAREKQELTQAQLASMINIDARTVLNIENDVTKKTCLFSNKEAGFLILPSFYRHFQLHHINHAFLFTIWTI